MKAATHVAASISMVHALDEAAEEGVGVVVFGAAVVAALAAAVVVAFCADAVAIKARARTKACKPKRETEVVHAHISRMLTNLWWHVFRGSDFDKDDRHIAHMD